MGGLIDQAVSLLKQIPAGRNRPAADGTYVCDSSVIIPYVSLPLDLFLHLNVLHYHVLHFYVVQLLKFSTDRAS